MKVIAVVIFAGIWATSSAQYSSYQQLSAPAPYQPPAPAYTPYQLPQYAPKTSYGPVQVGAPVPYTYPSPGPSVPCPTNLLLSCAPSVAPVPCQSVSYEKPMPPPPAPPPSYTKPAPMPPSYKFD